MKKSDRLKDDLRTEYDFASMRGGVRGKYHHRFREEGANVVLLDPDVAAAFPSEASVNEALRGVLSTTRNVRRTGGLTDKALQPASRSLTPAKPRLRSRGARG